MITPEDEDSLRLGMFAASLLVIALRQRTYLECDPNTPAPEVAFGGVMVPTEDTRASTLSEARAIVEIVVEEAKRLNAQRKTV